ncbi:uncharacterized protein LOC126854804 [Cataglyphis hispanica]|uniref:uncharacterized protein LOC126854804 n=1 Tax=Cataglyphis hispanica TaxID=1086592 RepID=UPI00217FA457|nr:uncharacterized protein LOC126854804 [Cataglyphis hispanica]
MLSDESLKINYNVFWKFACNSSNTLLAILYSLNHFGDYDKLLYIAGEIVEMREALNHEEEDAGGHIKFLLLNHRRNLTAMERDRGQNEEMPPVEQGSQLRNNEKITVEEEIVSKDRNNNNNINRKKIYQTRASQKQIEALVTYLEQHPNLTSDTLSILNGHEKLQSDWEKLARYLNESVSNKTKKDVKSWQKTWRNKKCKVLKKKQEIAKAIKENNAIEINLTEIDKRILKIIGCHKYVDLTNVPHSFPKKQNISKKIAIEQLRAENVRESFEIANKNTMKIQVEIKIVKEV